jgi:4'-phosphopantetheinyl transferase
VSTASVLVYRARADEPAAARPLAWQVARDVLGDRLGIAPEDVKISRQCMHCDDVAHGKPFVAGAPELSFSLSHSGSFVLVAVSEDACVGVDCEQVRERIHLDRLAARVLDADSYNTWSRVDHEQQLHSFLRAWTAKEAYLKAIGLGIATSLGSVSEQPEGWTMHALDQLPDYVACLAIDRPARVEMVDAG